ncbi:MAG: type II secretion system F family protein [Actinomycetota bacterium]|nr:type II secretion system F family protein [Actinomycetota bacterium]
MIVPIILLAGALILWPTGIAARRLRTVFESGPRRARRRWKVTTPLVTAVVALLGCLAMGPGGAVAGGMAGATAWRRHRNRHRLRATLVAVTGLAEALRSLVAELSAGAHPADAADAAATDAQPAAATVMRAAASAVRLGGDIDTALIDTAPELVDATTQLSRAWRLALRHGLPLADVLDAVRADLDQRVRFTNQVLARMAGPRASATVLALLPVLGVALGEMAGAEPIRVLTGSVAGQFLLVIGVGLACTGIMWSARLTGRVVFR